MYCNRLVAREMKEQIRKVSNDGKTHGEEQLVFLLMLHAVAGPHWTDREFKS